MSVPHLGSCEGYFLPNKSRFCCLLGSWSDRRVTREFAYILSAGPQVPRNHERSTRQWHLSLLGTTVWYSCWRIMPEALSLFGGNSPHGASTKTTICSRCFANVVRFATDSRVVLPLVLTTGPRPRRDSSVHAYLGPLMDSLGL